MLKGQRKDMHENSEREEIISILVELDSALAHFASETERPVKLADRLRDYANGVAEDLALPCTCEVKLQAVEGSFPIPVASFQVKMNGERCRMVYPTQQPPEISDDELAHTIMQVINRNCSLFITPSLCDQLMRQWSSEQSFARAIRTAQLSVSDFQWLCKMLVSRRFKVSRLQEILKTVTGRLRPGRDIETLFENAVADLTASRLELSLDEVTYHLWDTERDEAGAEKTPAQNYWQEMFDNIQSVIFDESGVIVPRTSVVIDTSMAQYELRLRVNDVRLAPLQLSKEQATYQGIAFWIAETIRANLGSFLVNDLTRYYLNIINKNFEPLVKATLALFTEEQLTGILRGLVDEGVSIKDLRGILEGLTSLNGIFHLQPGIIIFPPITANFYPVLERRTLNSLGDLGIDDFVNFVRISFKRYNYYHYIYLQNNTEYKVLQPDGMLRKRMNEIETHPLSDEEYCQLIQSIHHALKQLPSHIKIPLIMTEAEVRRNFKRQIEIEFPQIAVLSWQELSISPLVVAPISLTPVEQESKVSSTSSVIP